MSTDEPVEPEEDLEEDGTDDADGRSNRVMRFAKRLMDRKELAEDTKDLLWTVVATSDKAKNEAVRIAAKEVRNYLSELRLKDDLISLATSHSLEISISLKPLVGTPPPASPTEAEPDAGEAHAPVAEEDEDSDGATE